jgi:predicted dehydrogenase
VDSAVIPGAMQALAATHTRVPQVETDIRRVLQDNEVDAIVVAAPDHWHALATVWACQAGKHVYVEKPISHNIVEGRRMVEAARRFNKVVQVGTQRRSAPHFLSAKQFIQNGGLGKIPFVRTWIAGKRRSIGHHTDSAVPAGVDYNLWLGPAPQRAFNANRFHYNWHWNWDYGTGELGNNGIHALDMVRGLLNLNAPTRVSAGGGKYFYNDDQQTPDTHIATFDFAETTVIWEHRIWSKTGFDGQPWGVALYGQYGTMIFNNGWRVIDGNTASDTSGEMERPHLRNFIDCVKNGQRPNADIEEGHLSTRLCHLGNIALRVQRTLRFNAANETCTGDAEANQLLARTYRAPFVLPNNL